MPDINKAVKFMVDTANDNSHGYDQIHRNGPDYDCSSLVGTALHEAGFNISPSSSTWTLEAQLRKAGFVDCRAPWKAGDVHLSTNHHVIMSINEKLIAQASINENGGIKGGQVGDQTGNEINIKNYYVPSYGWDVHLRYVSKNDSEDEDMKEFTYEDWKKYQDRYTAEKASEGVPTVPENNWKEKAYQFVDDNHISDGHRPNSYVTRVEVWGMLRKFYDLVNKLIGEK